MTLSHFCISLFPSYVKNSFVFVRMPQLVRRTRDLLSSLENTSLLLKDFELKQEYKAFFVYII